MSHGGGGGHGGGHGFGGRYGGGGWGLGWGYGDGGWDWDPYNFYDDYNYNFGAETANPQSKKAALAVGATVGTALFLCGASFLVAVTGGVAGTLLTPKAIDEWAKRRA
jgi:hypothetical protein